MIKKTFIRASILTLFLLCVGVFAMLKAPMVLAANAETISAHESQESQVQAQASVLSQMSKEECLTFITENGVQIPDEFANNNDLSGFVKSIVDTIVAEPNYAFSYSYTVTRDFVDNIKSLVNNYCGTTTVEQPSAIDVSPMAAAAYSLQYNTVAESWSESFLNYNCYIYSIGRTDVFKDPGYFSGTSFSLSLSIYNMALVVKADLEYLGYENISISSTIPTVGTNQKVISIRKANNNYDYHFMRYDPNGWYHKPGNTAILRYNYVPSNDRIWVNEYSFRNVNYPGDPVYDSAIYYITFGTSPFTATVSNGNATIAGVKSGVTLSASVEIPSTININGTRYPVTAIGSSAFANQTQMSQITIPASVTSIGESAFWGCSNLTSITIPNNVTNMGPCVFAYCTGLTNVTFQATSKVTSIGESVFWGCDKLTSITIPNSVTNLGPCVFAYCTGLTNITFQSASNAVSIGESAFWGCANLSSITIPSSVASIGNEAFYSCTNLKTVTLQRPSSSGITTLGSNAFSGCSLTYINVPNVASINAYRNAANWSSYKSIFNTYGDWCNIDYRDVGGGAFSGTHGAGAPTAHQFDVATVLVNPTKPGYTFLGWYESVNGSGSQLTVLLAMEYLEDVTLYAKWGVNTPSWHTVNAANAVYGADGKLRIAIPESTQFRISTNFYGYIYCFNLYGEWLDYYITSTVVYNNSTAALYSYEGGAYLYMWIENTANGCYMVFDWDVANDPYWYSGAMEFYIEFSGVSIEVWY